MKTRICYTLLAAFIGASAPAQGQVAARFAGTWEGTLDLGPTRLRMALVVERDSTGLRGTMVSIDQGNARLPGSVATSGDTLAVTFPSVGARYRAVLNATSDSLRGTFTQGAEFSLSLHRTKGLVAASRPQDPKGPFPYSSHEVTFESVPGVRLSGTVTVPAGTGPFPAAVLITGSGPQNRDEELMGHKPFHVLADFLARRGIATLRYDDRGIGTSTGVFPSATSEDFARDAEAAWKALRSEPGIDGARVGFIGHSEGGLIAPMIAARNHDVAFLVMLAGPGVAGDSLLMLQSGALAGASGATTEQLTRASRFNGRMYDVIRNTTDSAAMQAQLRELVSAMALEIRPGSAPDANIVSAIMQQTMPLVSPWYRWFLRYDPRPALRQVKVPVLALNGTLDLQVPYRENLAAIRAALSEAGNRDVDIVEMPGLNHLFQTAKTGSISEYAAIDETIAPAVLDRIATFINQRLAAKR